MIVTIDPNAGFCYGVDRTIDIAGEKLAKDGQLYCLGQIVHNEEEERRLKQLGLMVINHNEFKQLRGVKVLIRAHGEPPETYKIAAQNNIQLIDASCPIVLSLQKKIRRSVENEPGNNPQVVIFGKKNHPELIGLAGQTGNTAIILENADDISQINFSKPVKLFAQTTQSPEKYNQIIALINERLKVVDEEGLPDFKAEKSICRHVSNRDETLKQFASDNDVVIFVGGENSSNGKYLFGVCQKVNPHSFYIQSPAMLHQSWLLAAKTVGVTGATSTPGWLLAGVAEEIKSLTNQSN